MKKLLAALLSVIQPGVARSDALVASAGEQPTQRSAPVSTFLLRFTSKDRVSFAKRLAFLLRAQVSSSESLHIICTQTTSRRLKALYLAVTADLEAGHFLSKSLTPYKNLFGEFTINLIRVGEQAGVLAENLEYLADTLARNYELERTVRSALIYPLFIAITTLSVTGFLVAFLFPKIMPIFISLSIELPLTTRLLLSLSTYLRDYGVVTVAGITLLLSLLLIIRTKYSWLRYATDTLVLRLPIIGPIARTYNAAHFCRTLYLTLRSGMVVSEALDITAAATRNLVYQKIYANCARLVSAGGQLSTSLAPYTSIFPPLVHQLLTIGESSGNLSITLAYLADLFDHEVTEASKNLSQTIEPIMLLSMGIVVGIIAVSVIAPIYTVTEHLGRSL